MNEYTISNNQEIKVGEATIRFRVSSHKNADGSTFSHVSAWLLVNSLSMNPSDNREIEIPNVKVIDDSSNENITVTIEQDDIDFALSFYRDYYAVKPVETRIVAMSIGNEYIEETFDNMKKSVEYLNAMTKSGDIYLSGYYWKFDGYQDFGDMGRAEIRGIHTSPDKLPTVEIPAEYKTARVYDYVVVTFPTEGIRIKCTPNRAVVDYEAEGHGHDGFETDQLLRAAYQIYKGMK